ncbi:MAG TPA: hypothetical protein VKQ08_11125 [Cyclobacteriaceae bacterium]|nr:hypothetical protein [Cyclobacteriaceae bacterium]
MRHPSYHGAQERFIIENAKEMTAKEVCEALGLDESVVRNLGSKHHLQFKKAVHAKPIAAKKLRPVLAKKQQEKVIFKRPAAAYSNSGYLATSQKYEENDM